MTQHHSDNASTVAASRSSRVAPASFRLVDAQSGGFVLLEVAPDGTVLRESVAAGTLVSLGVRIAFNARGDYGGRAVVQPGSADYVRALGQFLEFEGFQAPRYQWWPPGFEASVTWPA